MAKRRPKWAIKMPVEDKTEETKYPLSRCKRCPRRYYGLERDRDGNVLREFACWDTCFYTNQRRDSNESLAKNVV